ncbi:MAG: hypothetical protein HY253_14835 [Burkholderiales bacterium]|nr:hypothetical protein [Burkholderiales bacterium]
MKIIRPVPTTDAGTFTRASIATYYNNNGLLAVAAANEPRLCYIPADLTAPPAYMLEKASTNSLVYSEQFDNASWVKTGLVVTANALAAPDGNVTADQISGSGAAAVRSISQACPVSVTGKQVSAYAKAGTNNYMQIALNGDAEAYANFDIKNGVIGTKGTLSTASIVSVGNGWYRCTLGTTSALASDVNFCLVSSSSALRMEVNALTGTCFLWGAQCEAGKCLTSYIPTVAAAITRAADVYGVGIISNVPENDYLPYYPLSAYTFKERCIVVSTSVHEIYEASTAVAAGESPTLAPTKWVRVDATNRFRMFDAAVSSKTTNPSLIAFTFTSNSRVDSLGLMNILAGKVRVVQNTDDGVTYDKTVSLISTSGINNWYSWTFDPIEYISDCVVLDLPRYVNSTISVTIMHAGATPSCGAFVPGQLKEIGRTKYTMRIGEMDNSIKEKDGYGNWTIKERDVSKTGDFSVELRNQDIDQIKKMLSGYRAKPIVYVAVEKYTSTIMLGHYKDFTIDIPYLNVSACSIHIEGLPQ